MEADGKKVSFVDGEKAYQVGEGEPSRLLPCRVGELLPRSVQRVTSDIQ